MSIAMKNVYKPVGRGCKTEISKIRMMRAFQIQSMIFRRLSDWLISGQEAVKLSFPEKSRIHQGIIIKT